MYSSRVILCHPDWVSIHGTTNNGSTMGVQSLAKDFHNLLRNIDSFSSGQASVYWNDDNLKLIKIKISPTDGFYRNGEFIFSITPNQNRPEVAPDVRCLTRIYHPNIDTIEDDGDLCLSLLEDWQPHFSLQDVVQGFLFLLYNPNLEDALCPIFSPDMSEEEFAANVRRSLNGEEVEGYSFPRNQVNRDLQDRFDSLSIDETLKQQTVVACNGGKNNGNNGNTDMEKKLPESDTVFR